MRFIGNKENLLDTIFTRITSLGIRGERFFDFFSGTTNVARYFKDLGYQVESNDLLYLSFCLQKAYIENNDEPQFEKLLSVLNCDGSSLLATPLEIVVEYLNGIDDVYGFIVPKANLPDLKTMPVVKKAVLPHRKGEHIPLAKYCNRKAKWFSGFVLHDFLQEQSKICSTFGID